MKLALMPLRGGSKSIPLKNIKKIGGKPLFEWSLRAAQESGVFDKILVSTDSPLIAEKVKALEIPTVEVSMRPSYLAEDTTSTEDVMLHIKEQYSFDLICLIQATSPLTQKEDFLYAMDQFLKEKSDSLVTGVISKRFFWNLEERKPFNYDPLKRPRRQDFNGMFMENGAFYFTKREILEKEKSRLGGKISLYIMSEENGIELDEKEDWEILENFLNKRRKEAKRDFSKIKLVASDIDGTLTDAGMYYSDKGDELKKFNTRDGMAFSLLREKGIKTALITGERVSLNKRRADKLKVDYFYEGIKDKVSILKEIMLKENISEEEVVYIGDDINDLSLLRFVKHPFCPVDAQEEVKKVSFVLNKEGGKGAFREMVDLIMGKL